MRKIVITICIGLMILGNGCSFLRDNLTISINGDKELNPILEIATRRIAYKVITNDNGKIDYLINECDKILEYDIKDNIPLFEEALIYAVNTYTNDPMLADDIISLAKFYNIDLSKPIANVKLDMGQLRSLQNLVIVFRNTLKKYTYE